ncbi:unnamed protein product [Urochloa humidicola]
MRLQVLCAALHQRRIAGRASAPPLQPEAVVDLESQATPSASPTRSRSTPRAPPSASSLAIASFLSQPRVEAMATRSSGRPSRFAPIRTRMQGDSFNIEDHGGHISCRILGIHWDTMRCRYQWPASESTTNPQASGLVRFISPLVGFSSGVLPFNKPPLYNFRALKR